MSQRNAIQLAFDNFGRASGCEKKSGSWYRRESEVISVSNLQKSQYGPKYYINQGFWLRQIADELYPKENRCHIRCRLGYLLPDSVQRIEDLLDLDYELPEEQRIGELSTVLSTQLLPIIDRATSIAGLQALVDEGVIPPYLVTASGRSVLRIDAS